MKKYIVIAFLLATAILVLASQGYALDWSQYESGRDNIRLDGYDSQPGYIAFTGGDGVVRGYMYMDMNGQIFYIPRVTLGAVTTGAFDLTTTKISTQGYPISTAHP